MLNLQESTGEARRKMISPCPRRATSPYDFGDDATVGLCLKKRGYAEADPNERVFGIFLGQLSDGKFYVGTMSTFEWNPSDLEVFSSLNELQNDWRLD